jgi:3',5'-nucleoside bisphosphate phosphatase
LIDLHTHTTASDGRLAPADLVGRAAAAGVTVLSVTDHDTMASAGEARATCSSLGVEYVPGIEVTAVVQDSDVHVLGYFVDERSAPFQAFLAAQRHARVERIREIVARLATMGIVLDADAILQPTFKDPTRAPGRPWIAQALVAAGHADDTADAFSRWIARGRPAFVPRHGARPAEVIQRIHDGGGLASLAHPALIGPLASDEWIAALAADGLDAIEAYHSKHDAATTMKFLGKAADLGLEVTGGSDYHADPTHGPAGPGVVTLPPQAFERLKARLNPRRPSAHT